MAGKETIGFVGLGRMGRPMVKNIVGAGIGVACYARDLSKVKEIEAQGVSVVDSLATLAKQHDIFVSMVTDDKALEDVLFGSGNLASHLRAGSLFVSMSFNSPDCIGRVHERLAKLDVHFVNAPVFGRPEAADAAKLLVVAAGDEEDIARCAHVFAAVGRKTLLVGTNPRNGALTKLIGNFLVATIIEGFSEASVLARKSGLSAASVGELVQELFPAGGLAFQQYIQRINSGDYTSNVGATGALGIKDLSLMRAQADAVQCPLPIADIHHQNLRELQASGRGDWDWTGVAAVLAEHAGISLADKPDE